MHLGTHGSLLQSGARVAPYGTPTAIWVSHAYTRFGNCSVDLLMAVLFRVNVVGFNKYVHDEYQMAFFVGCGFVAEALGFSQVLPGWNMPSVSAGQTGAQCGSGSDDRKMIPMLQEAKEGSVALRLDGDRSWSSAVVEKN